MLGGDRGRGYMLGGDRGRGYMLGGAMCLSLTVMYMIHSLKYFYTGSSGVSNFPEFVAVGMVDELQFNYYDSNKITHNTWRGQTGIILGEQQGFKVSIENLKRRFNQTGGVHMVQRMYGCEWDDEDDTTDGYHQYGYDGEDFIVLDLKNLRWIAPTPQAFITKLRWDQMRAYKNYYNKECVDWLKKYLDYGKSTLQRTERPEVSLLQRRPSSPVVCHATGFYPDRVVVFWRRDGEELYEHVDHGEVLPNPDGTFQVSVDLDLASVPREDWRRYECVVQVKGIEDILTPLDPARVRTNWGKTGPGGDGGVKNDITTPIIIAVLILAAVAAAGVAGVFVYKKRSGSHSSSGNSEEQSPAPEAQPLTTYNSNIVTVLHHSKSNIVTVLHHSKSNIVTVLHRSNSNIVTVLHHSNSNIVTVLHHSNSNIVTVRHHSNSNIVTVLHHSNSNIVTVRHHSNSNIVTVLHHSNNNIVTVRHHSNSNIVTVLHHSNSNIVTVRHHSNSNIVTVLHHSNSNIVTVLHHSNSNIVTVRHHSNSNIVTVLHHSNNNIVTVRHHSNSNIVTVLHHSNSNIVTVLHHSNSNIVTVLHHSNSNIVTVLHHSNSNIVTVLHHSNSNIVTVLHHSNSNIVTVLHHSNSNIVTVLHHSNSNIVTVLHHSNSNIVTVLHHSNSNIVTVLHHSNSNIVTVLHHSNSNIVTVLHHSNSNIVTVLHHSNSNIVTVLHHSNSNIVTVLHHSNSNIVTVLHHSNSNIVTVLHHSNSNIVTVLHHSNSNIVTVLHHSNSNIVTVLHHSNSNIVTVLHHSNSNIVTVLHHMIHSLKYFYTASSGVSNFPEFVGVGMVDELQFIHYDSNSQKVELKQSWMDRLTRDNPQYLERETGIILGYQQDYKVSIENLKRRFNQTGGVHMYQWMYGCEWDDEDDTTDGYSQYGYDGEDFIVLDLKNLRWIAPTPQAFISKLKWDQNRARLEHLKNYYNKECVDWLKKYLDYGKSTLQRTERPEVSLLQRRPSSPVVCHATGFYPDRVVVFWRRDGEELYEHVDHGEVLPNPDGTFQVSVDLDLASVPREDWRRYECVVQVKGIEDILTPLDPARVRTNWGKTGPGGDGGVKNDITTPIIIAVLILAAVAAAGVAGVFVYKKRSGE
ncbi:Major histocompatibility complex class I-related gene protein [Merluccius polli]|uniref:Major histocompatibility complex class I-related gene protein n=1 Tax=Merluccius polli TaxID=89951 RepID=A0AA47N2L5_MERPO|nr:Major histocompatibility complex class I-related gene protein [Merluccius polli]